MRMHQFLAEASKIFIENEHSFARRIDVGNRYNYRIVLLLHSRNTIEVDGFSISRLLYLSFLIQKDVEGNRRKA